MNYSMRVCKYTFTDISDFNYVCTLCNFNYLFKGNSKYFKYKNRRIKYLRLLLIRNKLFAFTSMPN
jgi:hypothetical protein